jgi:hypothetical protein
LAKFSILGSFGRSDLATVVPPDYRARVRHVTEEGVLYTVILFPHDRTHGGVSTSTLVQRALSRVPATDRVLAVGADFTREATALLDARGAAVARIGEFGWTDESYVGIRERAR